MQNEKSSIPIKEQLKAELLQSTKSSNILKFKSVLNSISACDPSILNQPLDHIEGYSVLHHAILEGFEEGVRHLLTFQGGPKPLDINLPSKRIGLHPLYLAVQQEFYVIVDILVKEPALDLNFRILSNGQTALHCAAKVCNTDIAKCLLDAGAQVDMKENDGNTPLHISVEIADLEMVNCLLQKGADPKIKNLKGKTPLFIAIKEVDNSKLTQLLVDKKNPPKVATNHVKPLPRDNKFANNRNKKDPRLTASVDISNPNRLKPDPRQGRGTNYISSVTPKVAASVTPKVAASVTPKVPGSVTPQASHKNKIPPVNKGNAQKEPKKEILNSIRDQDVTNKKRRDDLKSACCQADLKDSVVLSDQEIQRKISEKRRESIIDNKNYYNMTARPRGICLIFNNETYWHENFADRSGADVDERRLEQIFKNFGYIVKIHKNMSASDIYWMVTNIAKNTDHSAYDSFVCCILSHGTLGAIYGIDGDSFKISEICVSLTATRCPSLAGKPKMFFIQACRGEEYLSGLDVGEYDHDSAQFQDRTKMIPDHADFLLSYATVAGFKAQRHKNNGSIYVQKLCNYLEEEAYTSDVLSILTKVNSKVSEEILPSREGLIFKQMPEVRHTLTKKIRFA